MRGSAERGTRSAERKEGWESRVASLPFEQAAPATQLKFTAEVAESRRGRNGVIRDLSGETFIPVHPLRPFAPSAVNI